MRHHLKEYPLNFCENVTVLTKTAPRQHQGQDLLFGRLLSEFAEKRLYILLPLEHGPSKRPGHDPRPHDLYLLCFTDSCCGRSPTGPLLTAGHHSARKR